MPTFIRSYNIWFMWIGDWASRPVGLRRTVINLPRCFPRGRLPPSPESPVFPHGPDCSGCIAVVRLFPPLPSDQDQDRWTVPYPQCSAAAADRGGIDGSLLGSGVLFLMLNWPSALPPGGILSVQCAVIDFGLHFGMAGGMCRLCFSSPPWAVSSAVCRLIDWLVR